MIIYQVKKNNQSYQPFKKKKKKLAPTQVHNIKLLAELVAWDIEIVKRIDIKFNLIIDDGHI